MTLTSGTRLGPYEIRSPLGEGGMGVVYRARDTRLDRDVAIKLLPDAFATDPDRVSRFEREAKLLATLNHPHIAQVYGLEDGRALVMELVDGPTLADRIAQGPLPLDELLPIARQLADALEAAHAQGIVHRDLKPANVKLRSDGTVKVLDFGLAKLNDAAAASAGMSLLPTVASPVATQAGVIVGTVAYMSPEQARGKQVDRRTDVWAFGCVLYEMLTGERPFAGGESTSDAIAAILRSEPRWTALPKATPEALERLLRRCLEKDVSRRLRDAGDARLELDDSDGVAADRPGAVAPHGRLRLLPWAVAVASIVAGLVTAWFDWSEQTPLPITRLDLALPTGTELFASTFRTVASSPDGRSVAFVGIADGLRQLYVRRLDQFDATALRGSDGATTVFFSPDGHNVGFITSAGELRTASLTDGVVTTVARNVSLLYGAAWSGRDRLVYVRDAVLWQVPVAAGSDPKALTTLRSDELIHAYPLPLPDGGFLFAVQSTGGRWHLEALAGESGERRVVLDDASLPLLGPDNRLFFYRNGRLLAMMFDAGAVAVTGTPVPVLEEGADRSEGAAAADVSSNGTIVYAPSATMRRLVWVSRQGLETPVTDVPRSYLSPRLSPDETRVVVQAGSLWVLDIRRNAFERLPAMNLAANAFPLWLPDGRRVMHRSGIGLRIEGVDGVSRGETLPGTTEFDYPGAIAAGDILVLLRNTATTSFDLLRAPLTDPKAVQPIVQTPAYEGGARLSADGKWIVYVSNESGRNEVYLRRFPDGERRWPVSTAGGTQPAWNGNNKEIFYRIGERMMSVHLAERDGDVELSAPQLLFERAYSFGGGITIANYDVTKDGQRFLMVKDDAAGSLRVVLNWSPDASR